jgi:hypothetical protein
MVKSGTKTNGGFSGGSWRERSYGWDRLRTGDAGLFKQNKATRCLAGFKAMECALSLTEARGGR